VRDFLLVALVFLAPALVVWHWSLRGLPARDAVPVRALGLLLACATAAVLVGQLRRRRTGEPPGVLRALAWAGVCSLLELLLVPACVVARGLASAPRFPDLRALPAPAAAQPPRACRIVHLSDLHLTGSADRPTGVGTAPGERLIGSYLELVERVAPELVVITGDITDAGEAREWDSARRLLLPLAAERTVLLAPGNHDLSAAFGSPAGPGERLSSFLLLQAELDRARRALEPASEPVRSEDGRPLLGLVEPPGALARQARRLFPLQWSSSDGATRVWILNSSVEEAPEFGRGVLGTFGAEQLSRLARRLEECAADARTREILVLLHHPCALDFADLDLRAAFDVGKLAADPRDSQRLVQILRERAGSAQGLSWALLFGHRHERSLGRLDRIWLLEAPDPRPAAQPESGAWLLLAGPRGAEARWIWERTLPP
jgi:hypothetical protein